MIIHTSQADSKPCGAHLAEMTWPEAAAALTEYPLMLLPVGAATKEHGYHLPLNSDWLQAEYLAQRLLEVRPLLCLPTLGYGHYPAFLDYPGSVSLEAATFRDTVVAICGSLAAQGARRFYVLNTGISTLPPLKAARETLTRKSIHMAYSDFNDLMEDLEVTLSPQPRGSHADDLETSTMLYIAPGRVNMERAIPELAERLGRGPFCREAGADCGLVSPSGAWGDPTLASREKGEVYVEELLRRLCREVDSLMPD